MRRSAAIAAGLVLGAGLLSGCGGDDGDSKAAGGGDYCDTLKAAAKTVQSFTGDSSDFSKFDDFIDAAKDLEEQAPSDLADDWKIVIGGMEDLTAAVEDSGITLEQLMAAATTGEMPPGVDQAKLMALAPKLQSLSGEEMEAATDAIDKHAKDECDVDLSTTD